MSIFTATEFNPQHLVVLDAVKGKFAGTSRMQIVLEHDGHQKPAYILTHKLRTFGVQANSPPEDKGKKDPKITGYQLPLLLRSGDQDSGDALVDVLTESSDMIVKKILEKDPKSVGRKDLYATDLRDFNPVYFPKDDKGDIDLKRSPVLYAKLKWSDKKGIETKFYHKGLKKMVNPQDYLGKMLTVEVIIHIESVFCSSKITPQIKIKEVIIYPEEEDNLLLISRHEEEDAEEEEDEEKVASSAPVVVNYEEVSYFEANHAASPPGDVRVVSPVVEVASEPPKIAKRTKRKV